MSRMLIAGVGNIFLGDDGFGVEVARLLAGHGAVVVDADALAREAVAPGTDGLARVAAEFGADVLAADGSLAGSDGSSVAATTCATSPGSSAADRSAHHAPPTKSARTASASATASRVLPAPPCPHSVNSLVPQISERSSSNASWRPTSLVS